MRKISFKGKRVDNNEWEYGYLCRYGFAGKEKYYIIPYYASDLYGIEVDPETVSQYTGLTDNNSKKIFVNDVLEIISKIRIWDDDTFDYANVERTDLAIVLDDEKTGGYRLKVYHKGNYKRISKFSFNHLIYYKAKIVGNIYDNPELIK